MFRKLVSCFTILDIKVYVCGKKDWITVFIGRIKYICIGSSSSAFWPMKLYFVWSGVHMYVYEYYCLKKYTVCQMVNSMCQSP